MFRFRKGKGGGSEMPFLSHLEELRWHLVRSAIAVLAIAVFVFINKSFVFDQVILAPKNAQFITYRLLCQLSERISIDLCIKEITFRLINVNLSGQFTLHMFVSVVAGIVLGFPYLVWELWRFAEPALTSEEKKYSGGIVFYVTLLFGMGVMFGYFVISPLAVNFLGSYQVSAEVANAISLDSYISTVTILTLSAGIVFELPMVVYFLTKIGLITPSFLKKYRRHSMVVILIIAAIITPSPDVVSQILVALPLFLLYEIGIWVSKRVMRNQERRLESVKV